MFAPMSLAVAVKAAAGVVLAADRRHTITAGDSTLHFDQPAKLARVGAPNDHVAVVQVGLEPPGPSFGAAIDAFSAGITDRLHVRDLAERLAEWTGSRRSAPDAPPTWLFVGAVEEGRSFLYRVGVPGGVEEMFAEGFGMAWTGEDYVLRRLVKRSGGESDLGPPYASAPIGACADWAVLLIETTIEVGRLTGVGANVGGQVDVAICQGSSRAELRRSCPGHRR